MSGEIMFLTHSLGEAAYREENGEIHGQPNKGLRGFLVELVKEIMVVRGYSPPVTSTGPADPVTIVEVPFARGLHMVQNLPDIALFNISRNPEREKTLKWVGPTHGSEVYLYKKKRAAVHILNYADAKRLKHISVQRSGEDYTFLQQQGFTNLFAINSQSQALQMLMLGRADAAPFGTNIIAPLARENNINLLAIERTPVKLFDTSGYLAFSTNIADSEVARWQQALDQLKSSERYHQLLEKYYRVTH
ncbi:MAG: polar amino acid transport system substrate-binding protein [Alteromonadaceae bacterium]